MKQLLPKILGVTILASSFIVGWLLMDVQDFLKSPVLKNDTAIDYVIAPGTSLTQMVGDLKKNNNINYPLYLIWYARWHDVANHIQAGEYEFQPGTRPREFLDQIVTGRVKQYSFTLIEGWTFNQLMDAVNRDEIIEHTLAGLDQHEIMVRLGLPDQQPEGRFYPDTYHITRGMTDHAILLRAYNAMEEHLDQAWQQRDFDLPYHSPYEALIMASIIEKESAVPDEREQIAGVFVRRLQKGMRLQTDPTVIYGLGEKYDGNLTRRDLKLFTPYNTYLVNGLPPTPIAMPGMESIKAALHPAAGNTLYFVSRGDGTHYFSSSVEEHNKAVAKYQLGKHIHSISSMPSDEDVTD